ncbi:hypothetical protein FQZ97_1105740 [compost metagenome]
MSLPLRVCGRSVMNASSLGATAAPRRFRAWPSNSSCKAVVATWPALRVTKAFTVSPRSGSGMPITAASATSGNSINTLSTSKGPIKWPADLITSSLRPTNQ